MRLAKSRRLSRLLVGSGGPRRRSKRRRKFCVRIRNGSARFSRSSIRQTAGCSGTSGKKSSTVRAASNSSPLSRSSTGSGYYDKHSRAPGGCSGSSILTNASLKAADRSPGIRPARGKREGSVNPARSLRSGSQDPGGNDQTLDFARPFVDFGDARVAVVALYRILAAVAVAAVNLNGFVRDARGHFARKQFGDSGVHAEACTSVLFPCGFAVEHAGCVNFRAHVRQHELNRLKPRNGLAERQALAGILQRGFERAPRNAGGLRGDADAPAIERRKRYLVAFAFVANAILERYGAIGKDQFTASGGMNAELFFFFANLESGCFFLHHDCGDAFFPFGRVGIHVHDRCVGLSATGDPSLRSVENIAVTFLYRLGSERCGVRAGLWLGEGVATDLFAARVRKEKSLLLCFGAVPMDRIAVKRILDGEDYPCGGATPRNLFDDDGVGDMIEARTAFIFGKRHAGETQLCRFSEQGARKAPGLVVLLCQRAHLRFGKLAHAFFDQFLFFRQFEVQLRALLPARGDHYFSASAPALRSKDQPLRSLNANSRV